MFEIRTTIELIGKGKVLGSEELLTGVNADGTPEDGTVGDFETMLEDILHEFRHEVQGYRPLRDFIRNSELGDGFIVFDDDEDNVYRLVKVGASECTPMSWAAGTGLNLMFNYEVWKPGPIDLNLKVKRAL